MQYNLNLEKMVTPAENRKLNTDELSKGAKMKASKKVEWPPLG